MRRSCFSSMMEALRGARTPREGAGPLPALLLDRGSLPKRLAATARARRALCPKSIRNKQSWGTGWARRKARPFGSWACSKRARSVERTLPGSTAWSRSLFLRASARPGTSTPMKMSGSTSSMVSSPSMLAMRGCRCRPVRSGLAQRGCPIRSSGSRPMEGKPLLASNRFCLRGSSERSVSQPPNVLCRHRLRVRRTWSGSSPSRPKTGWTSSDLQARLPGDSATGGARSGAEEEVPLEQTLASASGTEFSRSSVPFSYPYSSKCVEGEFSEVGQADETTITHLGVRWTLLPGYSGSVTYAKCKDASYGSEREQEDPHLSTGRRPPSHLGRNAQGDGGELRRRVYDHRGTPYSGQDDPSAHPHPRGRVQLRVGGRVDVGRWWPDRGRPGWLVRHQAKRGLSRLVQHRHRACPVPRDPYPR